MTDNPTIAAIELAAAAWQEARAAGDRDREARMLDLQNQLFAELKRDA